MPAVLSVMNLKKSYGAKDVLHGISFEVHAGEIFGFLGLNGAGKTTTLEIIEGLRSYDAGEISVFGLDHQRDISKIRERFGVSLQNSDYWGQLRVGELIDLFRSFYKKSLSKKYLLELFDLDPMERAQLKNLSGGQKQRFILCLALVNDPDLILLDEPTVGLDPDARRSLWNAIVRLKEGGKAVILTTHYMEEARQLCDRVSIIHNGRIECCGRPENLIAGLNSNTAILIRSEQTIDHNLLRAQPWCVNCEQKDEHETILYGLDVKDTLTKMLAWSEANGIQIDNLQLREPDMDDVFLHVTRRGNGSVKK